MKRVYLDYAAATPMDNAVFKKMAPFYSTIYGNPSSIHQEGRRAKQAIDKARSEVARILSARPDEIIFMGSGTESAAFALYGIATAYPKTHIITTSLEHAAVLKNIHELAVKGYRVSIVDPDSNGVIDPKKITAAIKKDTVLISIMYVNNEIGSVQPIRDVARSIRKERDRRIKAGEETPLYFHTDACQAAEYMPLSVPQLGVDLMTLNASKIYGPKGIGMLYKRRDISLMPLWQGGGQEKGMRGGTEYVAGIVGFAEALKITEKRKKKEYARIQKLQSYVIKEIHQTMPRVMVNGPPVGEMRVPNNIHITVPHISAETLMLYLDEKGVSASTGSACNADSPVSENKSQNGIRFTMGRYTTIRDVQYALKALYNSVQLLQ